MTRTLPTKPGPRELDLDIPRMRAEVFDKLRLLMRELDDLDVLERVLNQQTHEIAERATVVAHRNGNGNGHPHVLDRRTPIAALAAAAVAEEDEPRRTKRKKYKPQKDWMSTDNLKPQILEVLAIKHEPLRAGHIIQTIQKRFTPPYAAQSTFNRAIRELLQEGAVRINGQDGGKWPMYGLTNGKRPKRVRQQKPEGPYVQRGNPNGVGANVWRVVSQYPKGLTIPQIVAILDEEGTTSFLPDAKYTHHMQVSWAVKGHRNQHRIESVKLGDGIVHRPTRPALSVTKG